jgi:acyl carrier protein
MSELKEKLKAQLIEQLNLEDMSPSDIEDDMPLFGDGLGLDSIDALEIVVLLDTEYKLKLANPEEGKEIFHTINSLAAYIEKNS